MIYSTKYNYKWITHLVMVYSLHTLYIFRQWKTLDIYIQQLAICVSPTNYALHLQLFVLLLAMQPLLSFLQTVLVLQQQLLSLIVLRVQPNLTLLQLLHTHAELILHQGYLCLILRGKGRS